MVKNYLTKKQIRKLTEFDEHINLSQEVNKIVTRFNNRISVLEEKCKSLEIEQNSLLYKNLELQDKNNNLISKLEKLDEIIKLNEKQQEENALLKESQKKLIEKQGYDVSKILTEWLFGEQGGDS